MLSGRCKHSFFLAFCAFVVLLMMGGSAAVSAHARTTALLHDTAQHTSVAAEAHSASGEGAWQEGAAHEDVGGECLLVDDHDIDDELVLPSPLHVWLDYCPSAAPLSAGISPYLVPVALLLRPPSLA
jgi:hypothetical protein